jgi:hypothetical protein
MKQKLTAAILLIVLLGAMSLLWRNRTRACEHLPKIGAAIEIGGC